MLLLKLSDGCSVVIRMARDFNNGVLPAQGGGFFPTAGREIFQRDVRPLEIVAYSSSQLSRNLLTPQSRPDLARDLQQTASAVLAMFGGTWGSRMGNGD